QHTNKYHALGQMLPINPWLDKLAASQADFDSRGMLQGTCLSTILDQLGKPMNGSVMKTKTVSQSTIQHQPALTRAKHNQASTVVALANHLHIPNLSKLVHTFLVGQLYPDDNCDPADIPHLECPGYEGRISIHNSASLTFYAPSDLSGIGGMH
ncbi:hypothetical protein EV401DRAFT_1826024, partial [Pisolithus croceorrhizus]